MGKMKKLIKRILVKMQLYEEQSPQQLAKKQRPDFDITTRNKPYFSFENQQVEHVEIDFKIAIQVHVFFMEIMDEVVSVLNSMPFD